MQIELILENCDSITFNEEYIKLIKTVNTIGEKYVNYFKLIIKKDGNIPYKEFGIDEFISISPFTRILEYNDITSITIHEDDGTEKYIFINYKEVDDFVLGSPNKYQKSYIDEDGNLIIIIDSREICF